MRRSVAMGTSLILPVLTGFVIAATVRPFLAGVCLGWLFAGGLTAASYSRVRRRVLTLSAEGLEVQRDKYRLFAPWHAVTGVQGRRHQRVMRVEELLLAECQMTPLDGRGRP